jgi:hypothetical protein
MHITNKEDYLDRFFARSFSTYGPLEKKSNGGNAVPILAMQGSFYETLSCHAPIYLDKQLLERSVDCGEPST